MATYTSNYAWTKPEGSDPVDIGVLNNNLDSQDSIVHNAYMQLAPVFSATLTYAVDDVVLYSNNLYKCITAVTVAGDWDAAKWTQVKVSDIAGGGGGGGTSDYTQLTNKPSINSVTLSGNKTSADLGLQDAIQIDTMPTASATYDGKIVQFAGTTTASYTHGYYYECINDGGTYSWSQLNVQPSSGGGTSDYTDLTNKPQINGVTLTGNKSTSDLGINAAGVGLGNVPNVATDDQTPTFTTAQSRNNLVSGEKLSVMLGKISKFFNDLKTVAFTGSFSDLSNKPENSNTFQGTIAEWNQLTTAEKKAYDHASIPDSLDGNVTFPASKVMMQNGNSVQNEMHYKYGDAIVGTDGLQLPNDWNELLIFAQYGTSGGLQNQTLQVTINKDITSKLPYGAYIFGAGTMAGQAYISNNTLSLLSFQVNGTEYKTTSKIFYYYR